MAGRGDFDLTRLAKLANQDPLLRAADRWRILRRFAPDLIEALEFCAVRAGDPMLAALHDVFNALAEAAWLGIPPLHG